MMGQLNRNQGQLFYSFCLEEVVPTDHLVRGIAAVPGPVARPRDSISVGIGASAWLHLPVTRDHLASVRFM